MPSIARLRPRGATIIPFPSLPRLGSFAAVISGDIQATLRGDASFGAQPSPEGGAPSTGLWLGALSAAGGIMVVWTGRTVPGHYTLDGCARGATAIRARVFLGPAERPIAELSVESGTLTLAEAGPRGLGGSFAMTASGRGLGGRAIRVSLTGTFSARTV